MKHADLQKPEIRLSTIQQMAKGGRWRTEAMRSLSTGLFLWFTSGQGRITIAGVTRGYGPHSAIFIPAGTMHGFEVSPKVFGTAVFLPRSPDLPLPEEPLQMRVLDVSAQAELNACLQDLQAEAESRRPLRETALRYRAGLLSVWLHRQARAERKTTIRPGKAAQLVMRYTDLIEHEFRTGKTVSDYAALLGVTPTHLSRVCNQACGRPASALLSDRVLYEARRLLSETRDPIKDVARRLGFASAAYFTRAFQNHTGQTPSAFRRAARTLAG